MELVFKNSASRSLEKQCKLSDYVSNKVAATIGETRIYHTPAGTPSSHSLMEQQNKNDKILIPRPNPVTARIQHDLRSPSANLRLRALKAIKNPAKSCYSQFDIPHEERSIITQEERDIANAPAPTLEDIMSTIVVYVEVRTGEDNRSAGVKKVIAALGARVNDKLLRDTTHVVFKDGLMSTYKKAKIWNIPVVSILWIEACKNVQKICNPEDFPISNLDRYENPELYEKMKRHRSMQPDSECNRRIRSKNPQKDLTPKTTTVKKGTSTPIGDKFTQPEISRYFTSVESSVKTPNKTATPLKGITDSPATILINRMTTNTYTPVTTINKNQFAANAEAVLQENENTPLTARRCSFETNITSTTDGFAQLSICQTPTLPENDKIVRKKINQKRRTLLPIKTPSGNAKDLEKDKNKPEGIVLMTEEIVVKDGKTANAFSIRKAVSRRTTYSYKPMEISDLNSPGKQQVTLRRRTLYTPQTMLQTTNVETIENPDFTNEPTIQELEFQPITYTPTEETEPSTPTVSSQEEKLANDNDSPNINDIPCTAAAQQNGRRRTLFDISMDIISHQVQDINSKTRLSIALQNPIAENLDDDVPVEQTAAISESVPVNHFIENSSGSSKTVITAAGSQTEILVENTEIGTTEKKKRKLFRPVDSSPFTPPSITPSKTSTQMSRRSVGGGFLTTPRTSSKRRRTIVSPQVVGATNLNDVQIDTNSTIQQSAIKKKTGISRSGRRSPIDFEVKRLNQLRNNNNVNYPNGTNVLKECNMTKTVEKPLAKKRLPFLAFTNMHKEEIEVINEAVDKLGGFHVDRCVGSLTTHMVSLEARRTMNLLRGLVRGLWILDYRWVTDSLLANKWLPEEQYEMTDFSRSVEICRAERQAFGNSYKCELFADLGAFFVSPRCDTVPIRDLKELIRLCGGKIVEQRANAKYILSSSTKAIDDKIYVTPLWILDSITQMQLLRIQKYSGMSQLPTLSSASNTRNMPTAVEVRDVCTQRIYNTYTR